MKLRTEPIFRPLQTVPDRHRDRRRSQFKAGWETTLIELDRELQLLGAEQVVIQIDCDESQIRRDGWPRSGAIVSSPAVAIAFESDRGFLTYPCDTYTHWQDNIRAIAKGLEALRAVDRYGIAEKGEQYTGWKRLEFRQHSFNKASEAAAFLAGLDCVEATADLLIANRDRCRQAIAQAIAAFHPDHGGNSDDYQRVLAAKETLDRYHGELKLATTTRD